MSPPKRLTIGQRFEDYIIEELLGEGAFGAVYKARHAYVTVPGKHGDEPLYRAIKQLSHSNQSVIDRFRAEAGVLIAMSRVTGSNVTQVYDWKENSQGHFLIMEYVPGGTLELAARRQIPEATLIRIAIEICKGLDVMHRNAPTVVHRDLKPANVKVEFLGAEIKVKILDFGVAAILSGRPKSEVVGTFAFAGPTQMKGETASPFMDQHSLGATLFYCMMDPRMPEDERFAPFPFESWQSAAERDRILARYPGPFQTAVKDHFHGRLPASWNAPVTLSKMLAATGYTSQLQAAVCRMMAPDNADKFTTIKEAQLALERMLGLGGPSIQIQTPRPTGPVSSSPPPPTRNTSGAFLPVKKKTTGSS